MYHYLVSCIQCGQDIEIDMERKIAPHDGVLCGGCELRIEMGQLEREEWCHE